ncbi:hypothetical protein [Devosia sp. CAU 1758]
MDQKQRPLLWTLVAISAATFALGVFALRAEAETTALGSGTSRLPTFIGMISDQASMPLSVQGRRVLLDMCEIGMQSTPPLLLRFASEQQRQLVLPFCERLAGNAVAAARTDSYAWLVLAMAQIRHDDLEAASQSIVWSGRTGSTESWIARSRFSLIQDHHKGLSPSAREIGDADTILLVSTNKGADVARRYLEDPAFRQRAEALIETQPQAVQRRFVSLLRRQL